MKTKPYERDREVIFLAGMQREMNIPNYIPEIKIGYNPGKIKKMKLRVTDSGDVAKLALALFKGMEDEQFIILFLNNDLELIGYYRDKCVSPWTESIDLYELYALATQSMAISIIVAYNHNSDSVTPTDNERNSINSLRILLDKAEIKLLDALCFNNEKAKYSFVDEGKIGNIPDKQTETPELTLSGLDNYRLDRYIPKLKIRRNKSRFTQKPIAEMSTNAIASLLRRMYGRAIVIQEYFLAMFCNDRGDIIGFYKHTIGTPISTQVDVSMIVGIATSLKATQVIVSHNHPSGNNKPSKADINLTKHIVDALKVSLISLYDHIIVTKESYYSFENESFVLGAVRQKPKKPGAIISENTAEITINFEDTPSSLVISRLAEIGFEPNDTFKRFVIPKYRLQETYVDYLYYLLEDAECDIEKKKLSGLGMAYVPASEQGKILDVATPDSMGFEMHIAIRKAKQEIGKDLFSYVAEKLKYSHGQLINALSAEQIDAVAMSIYNIEKGKGIIIGDQTGIGKGRVAASMIRYGVVSGVKPIFLSEKANLFSDMYRDLSDIGSEKLKPFIVNAKGSLTHVKDKEGEVVYTAPEKNDQTRMLEKQEIPGYDYIMATYTQFNQPEKKPLKPNFIRKMASGSIVIMDEAHNASGNSNVGLFLQDVLRSAKGVVFLSATYAKRPDNMPIYAMKTSMSEANLSQENLIEAIQTGGVALQEVLSSQLVSEGQLIRRERTFEGIEINYETLYHLAPEHKAIADNITSIIRDIIEFQDEHIKPSIDQMDEVVKGEQKEAVERQGTSKAGVDSPPYFSKVFNVINQMLFSIKANAVADRAIERLKQGKKPVIAFANTMGAFLEELGEPGELVDADFSSVLSKGLTTVMKYSVKNEFGESEKASFSIHDLNPDAQEAYSDIVRRIETVSTGISISPIDVIKQRIQNAGYAVSEVTGRKYEVQFKYDKNGNMTRTGLMLNRKRENVVDAFRQFNDNEVDVLMINQSGSTGASAHAIVTDKVPAQQVKQRVMIILQAELNINTEIQKRGRINRTGQILKPIYDYVISAIPAEQRLMMMLRSKLKSLDANTTANQRSSEKQLNLEDFLNKIGDKVVRQYLIENPDLVKKLNDPLKFESDTEPSSVPMPGDASKVTGRVAVLPVSEQDEFYKEIMHRYEKEVEYLISVDEYDLEVETLNLQAKVIDRIIAKAGKGGSSPFGQDVYLDTAECNVLRKPFTKSEIDQLILEALNGKTAEDIKNEILESFRAFELERVNRRTVEIQEKWERVRQGIEKEAKFKKLESDFDRRQYKENRLQEIEDSQEKEIVKERNTAQNRDRNIKNVIEAFKIGAGLRYPNLLADDGTTPALFLGFHIDEKRKNPYAPSAIEAKFAIADSRKYVKLNLSGDQRKMIDKIIAMSYNMQSWEKYEVIENWDELIKKASVDRASRFIFTGNLLVAAGSFNNGKLVQFTTHDNKETKGLLMPASWSPENEKINSNINVPLHAVTNFILGSTNGSEHRLDLNISIFKLYDEKFKIIMPKRRDTAAIYKDRSIIQYLINDRDGFEMRSGEMVGSASPEGMAMILNILAEKFSLSMNVTRRFFNEYLSHLKRDDVVEDDQVTKLAIEMFEKDKEAFESRSKSTGTSSADRDKKFKLAKAKAKAIKLKLKMLNL